MRVTRLTEIIPHMSYKRKNIPTQSLFFTSHEKYNPSPSKLMQIHSNGILPSLFTTSPSSLSHKEDEILPTIEWNPSLVVDSTQREIDEPEKIGFIILRHVNSSITNHYWKECYRCIKTFYPRNRILIIDDNSNKTFLTNEPLENTMIIQSEFPRRGEFLPYYYYLKTKFCETAVILHDSVFIKKYIDFTVNNYKIIINFSKKDISDNESLPYQMNLLSAINNEKLTYFYNKKNLDAWSGCFGSMSVIKYDYLKSIDSEFRLACLIPHITCRTARCAFERIIGCLLQVNMKEECLLGSIHMNCMWGLTYRDYLHNKYNHSLPLIKIFTGR